MPMVRLDGEVGWFFTRDQFSGLNKDIDKYCEECIEEGIDQSKDDEDYRFTLMAGFLCDEDCMLSDPGSYPVKNYKGE